MAGEAGKHPKTQCRNQLIVSVPLILSEPASHTHLCVSFVKQTEEKDVGEHNINV